MRRSLYGSYPLDMELTDNELDIFAFDNELLDIHIFPLDKNIVRIIYFEKVIDIELNISNGFFKSDSLYKVLTEYGFKSDVLVEIFLSMKYCLSLEEFDTLEMDLSNKSYLEKRIFVLFFKMLSEKKDSELELQNGYSSNWLKLKYK